MLKDFGFWLLVLLGMIFLKIFRRIRRGIPVRVKIPHGIRLIIFLVLGILLGLKLPDILELLFQWTPY